MRRTRRCAQTRFTELATRNGSIAHVHQTVDAARRVVGVQRREHEVARERRLDGDRRRLAVADFADEDDVGVLPQERPQDARRSVRPMLSRTGTWLMPGRLNSTGSSAVMMFMCGSLIRASDE